MRTRAKRIVIGVTAVLAAVCAVGAAPPPPAIPPASPVDEAFRLRMAGRSDDAQGVLERALAADAGNAAAWKEMARVHFYHLDFDEAARAVERAIAIEPDDAPAHELAGVLASYRAVWFSKRPETRDDVSAEIRHAIDELERAVALDPTNGEAAVMLVSLYVNNRPADGGDRGRAEAIAAMLEVSDPVAGTEARCLVRPALDDAERIARWERLAAARPDDAAARAGLASAYLDAEDTVRARAHIEAAIALDPEQRDLLIELGRTCALIDEHQQAEAAFRQYLDADPAPPAPMRATVTFFVAVVWKRQGNEEPAEALLAEAKGIDPRCWTFFKEPPKVLFQTP